MCFVLFYSCLLKQWRFQTSLDIRFNDDERGERDSPKNSSLFDDSMTQRWLSFRRISHDCSLRPFKSLDRQVNMEWHIKSSCSTGSWTKSERTQDSQSSSLNLVNRNVSVSTVSVQTFLRKFWPNCSEERLHLPFFSFHVLLYIRIWYEYLFVTSRWLNERVH